ncbi:uncharacterized protein LOC119606382 [Lucilia sericata]|uniref:uncharacterized protein LOC119606382 n=1 Tax=Lucilia sericata TaxID=13632 RepID=UPI0018A7E8E8|nr:uncharacterized protein LOC119606382 [Lucilia sericata]
MSKQYCNFGVIIISYLNLINAASIPLHSLISSTYKPSILLLPPGFESQKAPRQPMLYPYAVSSASLASRPTSRTLQSSTTVGWIPLAAKDLPLIPTTPTLNSYPVPVLEDRISHDEPEYSSPSNNDGPVFESIVYGTWKPDPPLQPVEILNGTKQQQQHNSGTIDINASGLVVNGKVYNKTINRQHGGFIGHIQQKPTKADRQNLQKYKHEKLSTTSSSLEHKSKESTEMSSEQKLQRKLKKQGRQKIRPISSTTEQTSIERNPNREEEATTTTAMTTKENIQYQPTVVIKVNSTDPKLMEVVKQINESIEIKYNHKQTSPHSNDMMTTASANNNDRKDDHIDDYNEELGVLKTQTATKSTEFMSTEPQFYYEDDDVAEILENISATRRSWPTDFMDESLDTTESTNQQTNLTNEVDYSAIDGIETDPSEIPLALSALNIPPSLWPKLPGNITKLGKPYETQSSAEEPALCVPITVREQNMINSKELVYIERVFCFPMPPSTTTSENSLRSTITDSTTTLRSATKAKVQNYNDFIDSTLRVTNISSSNFKGQLYLVTFILAVYFKFIV